jgi:anti-sigma factor RsiW
MRDPHTDESGPSGCVDARDLLPSLLHGRLAGAERARAEAHVAGCAPCAAEFRLVRDAHAALLGAAPRVDPAVIAAAVRAATVPPRTAPDAVRCVQRGDAGAALPGSVPARSRWRTNRPWQAVAAALVIALGAGGASLFTPGPRRGPVVAAVPAGGPARERAPGPAAAPDGPAEATHPPANASSRAVGPVLLAAAEPGLGTGLGS